MMKLRGLLTVVAMIATLGITPPAFATQTNVDIYSESFVSQITIQISSASASKLRKTPKKYVAATVSISGGGNSLTGLVSQMHLKGSSTLRQNPSLTSSRPSIRVKLDSASLKANGIQTSFKSLTLNSMSQDSSKIHEWSSYKLFNAMRVPAPRVGYANVKVIIGSKVYKKGLYSIIEPYDDKFFKAHFSDKTQHVYENCGLFDDITSPKAAEKKATCTNYSSVYEVKMGWKATPNKNDIAALKAVQKRSSNSSWWEGLGQLTDRSELIRQWAVENYISSWDSYSGSTINNYYLRSNSSGVFTMLPTGTDETFGSQSNYNFNMMAKQIGYPLIKKFSKASAIPRGRMFTRCLSYVPCRNEYLDDLKATAQTASSMGLIGQMKYISNVIKNYSKGWIKTAQRSSQNWVTKKNAEVNALLRKYGRN